MLAVPLQQLGFFEYFALTEDRAIPLDDRVPDEEALLAQPFGTVLFALKKLPNMIDKDVVVVGQGPIGQMFNAGLRNMGARNIVGVDVLLQRLGASKAMGATHTICSAENNPADELSRILNGGSPDVVIEAVGHRAQALNLCVELCGYGSTLLYFGVPPETIDGIRWKVALHKNLKIQTSVHPDFNRDFPIALQWIAERRVNLRPLLTHRFKLDQIQEAFDIFRDRTDGAQKVLVEFPALSSA